LPGIGVPFFLAVRAWGELFTFTINDILIEAFCTLINSRVYWFLTDVPNFLELSRMLGFFDCTAFDIARHLFSFPSICGHLYPLIMCGLYGAFSSSNLGFYAATAEISVRQADEDE
jgi:hypothetical protein